MNIEIVSIGNELLAGDVVDTNAAHLARSVARYGLRVHRSQTVPDVVSAIVDALALAAGRSDVVVVSGGLGPTTDDLTTEAAARLSGVDLELHQPSLDRIVERFRLRGMPFKKNNEKQAWFPKGAEVLENPVGTAPGFALSHGAARLFFLPGVHREYVAMIDASVLPRLAAEARGDVRWRTLRTFGMTESAVGDALSDIPLDDGLFIQYRASFPEILVTPVVRGADAAAADARLGVVCAAIRERLGAHVYGEGADSFPAVVGALLRERGLTLAAAESCTGGRVAQMMTSVPGSSDVFLLGAVTYSNAAKAAVLGVRAESLAAHGAVSEQVAREMVEGVARVGGASVAVAITGIAGPGGGTDDKPVGTVHFAVSVRGQVSHVHHRFTGDRRWIQTIAAWRALDLVRRALVDAA
jgi:nicotinamide-nucleotide amidase